MNKDLFISLSVTSCPIPSPPPDSKHQSSSSMGKEHSFHVIKINKEIWAHKKFPSALSDVHDNFTENNTLNITWLLTFYQTI